MGASASPTSSSALSLATIRTTTRSSCTIARSNRTIVNPIAAALRIVVSMASPRAPSSAASLLSARAAVASMVTVSACAGPPRSTAANAITATSTPRWASGDRPLEARAEPSILAVLVALLDDLPAHVGQEGGDVVVTSARAVVDHPRVLEHVHDEDGMEAGRMVD